MKVLWLTGMVLPCFASAMGEESKVVGGWLTGMYEQLKSEPNLHIITAYPSSRCFSLYRGNPSCYAIPVRNMFSSRVDQNTVEACKELLAAVQPDLVHIWGAEWPHSLAMAEACIALQYIDRTVVNLQGNNGSIAYHMKSGIPKRFFWGTSFHDFVRHNSLLQEQKRLLEIEKNEKKLIEKTKYVIGRTEWDKAWSQYYHNDIVYFHCNEIIRDSFYRYAGAWNLEECEKHSILCGLPYSPVKGLHYLLQALKMVQRRYPDAKLYVLGDDITRNHQGIHGAIRITTYGRFIKTLIEKLELRDSVVFLGMVEEGRLVEILLKRHLYVSASSIENESNLLSEARMLGVPSVVSYVGGVTSRAHDGIDCYSYQHDDTMMLQHYICKVFGDIEATKKISSQAVKIQKEINDREKNAQIQMNIYRHVLNCSSGEVQ